MAQGYTRQSTANIVNGAVIDALYLNNEFDQIQAAMNAVSGHVHDGSAGQGGKLSYTALSGVIPVSGGGTGMSTNAFPGAGYLIASSAAGTLSTYTVSGLLAFSGTTLQVPTATSAQAEAGTATTVGMTPQNVTNFARVWPNSLTLVTPVSGDELVISDASDSGNAKVVELSAAIALFPANSMVLLTSAVAASATSLDFTGLTGYKEYKFVISNIVAQTDGTNFKLQTSTNNGSSYQDMTDVVGFRSLVGTDVQQTGSDANLFESIGNATTNYLNGIVTITRADLADQNRVHSWIKGKRADEAKVLWVITGGRGANADIDAVRFLMDSGNVLSGSILAYGAN